MTSKADTNAASLQRHGLTLVELLMVMGILSILAGLTIAALGTGLSAARENQTKTIIATIDGVLQERLEFYETQVLDSGKGAFRYFHSPTRRAEFGSRFESANSTLSASSVNYFVERKLLASVFPQSFRDLCGFDGRPGVPEGVGSLPNGLNEDDNGDTNVDFINTTTVDLLELGLGGRMTDDPPTAGVIRRAVEELGATVDLSNHSVNTESSEILYLCLTNEIVPGIAALEPEDIPGSLTKDSDNDGLLEILDGWEQQLRFYSFSTGLFRPVAWTWNTSGNKTNITFGQSTVAAALASGAVKVAPANIVGTDRTNALNRDLRDRFDSVRQPTQDLSSPETLLASAGFSYAMPDNMAGSSSITVPNAPGLPISFGTPSFMLLVSAGPDEALGLGEPTETDSTRFAQILDESDALDNLTNLQGRRR